MNHSFETEINTSVDVQKTLRKYLHFFIKQNGSDLFIKSNSNLRIRIKGLVAEVKDAFITHEEVVNISTFLLGERIENFIKYKSMDLVYSYNDEYRFRINIFYQIQGISIVFRAIPKRIRTLKELMLPDMVGKICDEVYRGLILITGPTGSGKTTTATSMIDRLNHKRANHIITIEDPVEYVFKDDKSIINQRSIGIDCIDFSSSLRSALREDPDIIFVGEMRDVETTKIALAAAETGHLVFSTLHTVDAKETITRILSMFDSSEQNRIKSFFASVLEGIISQRLVITEDKCIIPIVEVLRNNARIKEMILKGKTESIIDAIAEGNKDGIMQTFDQNISNLYYYGVIDAEEALDKATNRDDMELIIKKIDLEKFGHNEEKIYELKSKR